MAGVPTRPGATVRPGTGETRTVRPVVAELRRLGVAKADGVLFTGPRSGLARVLAVLGAVPAVAVQVPTPATKAVPLVAMARVPGLGRPVWPTGALVLAVLVMAVTRVPKAAVVAGAARVRRASPVAVVGIPAVPNEAVIVGPRRGLLGRTAGRAAGGQAANRRPVGPGDS